MQPTFQDRYVSRSLLDVLIKAGLIAGLAMICYTIFQPFLSLMLWGLILGVTFYPLHCRLKVKLGLGDGPVAVLIVLVSLLLLIVPVYLLGISIAQSAHDTLELIRSGNWHIPPPNASVADWPLVGPRLYDFWQQASSDLTSLVKQVMPHVQGVAVKLVGILVGVGAGFILFLAALIVAGVFMAYGDRGQRSAVQIASKISGPDRGPQIALLCTATIRAVAQGVVGIAFIQMLLVGIGFIMMGVPGAGLLALAVLLLAILQLPVLLITLPVIGYVLSTDGVTAGTIVFSIYSFVAGLIDNVLKPLLLGRGVDVPMPVILIGALGGMVTGGVIGLFVGPVLLAVGYMLFWQWVDQAPAVEHPLQDDVTP